MVDPIQENYRKRMNELAAFLDELFNGDKQGHDREVGFCLMVFDFHKTGKSGRMNYISNSDRGDMISAIKEYIAHLEGRHIAGEHDTKQ